MRGLKLWLYHLFIKLPYQKGFKSCGKCGRVTDEPKKVTIKHGYLCEWCA